MKRINALLPLFLLAIPLLASSQTKPTPCFADILREDHFWQLRLQLPNHLHVSGPSIKLPSGRPVTGSVLAMIAVKEQAKVRWTLDELANALHHEHHHVRYAALCLLTKERGITEDFTSYMMSRGELESSGVAARWKKIALDSKTR